jgi:hypothetical protein
MKRVTLDEKFAIWSQAVLDLTRSILKHKGMKDRRASRLIPILSTRIMED